jgi:DnaJ-class molecular chaperone
VPVKLRAETPEIVQRYGWRDDPYEGDDQCDKCRGWGERSATYGGGALKRVVHRTCEKCLGKGHI